MCLILGKSIFTFVCTDWESWHDFISNLRFPFVCWWTSSSYLLTISSRWSNYSWFFHAPPENMPVIFVIIRRSFSIHVIPYALTAALHCLYFVLLGFCVFDVLSLVDSLLLETWINSEIRERTGPWLAGDGLGGIFDWIKCISYIIGKHISPSLPPLLSQLKLQLLFSPFISTYSNPSSAYSFPFSFYFYFSSSAHLFNYLELHLSHIERPSIPLMTLYRNWSR